MKKKNQKLLVTAVVTLVVLIALAVPVTIHHYQKTLLRRISDSYTESASATSEKYDGKKITFLAEVATVDISEKQMTVELRGFAKDSFKNANVGCVTTCHCSNDKDLDRLAKLKNADNVKVTGTAHLKPSNGMLLIDVNVDKLS